MFIRRSACRRPLPAFATLIVGSFISSLVLATASASAAPSLQLPWPTGQVHRISSFGSGYGCDFHQGRTQYALDFDHTAGQQVSAVAAGTARSGVHRELGNYVWIDHGEGLVSIYAHFSSFSGGFPRAVSQGEVIGGAGNTGASQGAHLHFVMRSGASGPFDGTAFVPEPMSGYSGFGAYGCGRGTSPPYTSQPTSQSSRKNPGGDFTGDGKADLLYQDNGSTAIRLLTSNGATGGLSVFASEFAMSAWRVAGDFSGDGKADLMYQDPGSDRFHLLTSNGATGALSVFASGFAKPAWQVSGSEPSETSFPAPAPTPSPTPSPSPSPTPSPSPSPTPSPSPSPTPSAASPTSSATQGAAAPTPGTAAPVAPPVSAPAPSVKVPVTSTKLIQRTVRIRRGDCRARQLRVSGADGTVISAKRLARGRCRISVRVRVGASGRRSVLVKRGSRYVRSSVRIAF